MTLNKKNNRKKQNKNNLRRLRCYYILPKTLAIKTFGDSPKKSIFFIELSAVIKFWLVNFVHDS